MKNIFWYPRPHCALGLKCSKYALGPIRWKRWLQVFLDQTDQCSLFLQCAKVGKRKYKEIVLLGWIYPEPQGTIKNWHNQYFEQKFFFVKACLSFCSIRKCWTTKFVEYASGVTKMLIGYHTGANKNRTFCINHNDLVTMETWTRK